MSSDPEVPPDRMIRSPQEGRRGTVVRQQPPQLPRRTAITRRGAWDVSCSWSAARDAEEVALDGVMRINHSEVVVNLRDDSTVRGSSVSEVRRDARGAIRDVRMEYATGTPNVRSPTWMRIRINFRNGQMMAEVEGDDRVRVAGVLTLLAEVAKNQVPAKSPTPAPTLDAPRRRWALVRRWFSRPWFSSMSAQMVGALLATGIVALVAAIIALFKAF